MKQILSKKSSMQFQVFESKNFFRSRDEPLFLKSDSEMAFLMKWWRLELIPSEKFPNNFEIEKVAYIYHGKCSRQKIRCTIHRKHLAELFDVLYISTNLTSNTLHRKRKSCTVSKLCYFLAHNTSNAPSYSIHLLSMLEFRRTPFSTFCKVLKLNVENNSRYCIFRDRCILRK